MCVAIPETNAKYPENRVFARMCDALHSCMRSESDKQSAKHTSFMFSMGVSRARHKPQVERKSHPPLFCRPKPKELRYFLAQARRNHGTSSIPITSW